MRPTWSTQLVPSWPGIHRESWSPLTKTKIKKKKTENKQTSKKITKQANTQKGYKKHKTRNEQRIL